MTREQIDAAKSILEQRLDANNISDRELYPDYGNGRIIVRYPWKSNETEFNPEKAIQELGASAVLTFRDPDGNVLLTGSKDVKKATAAINPETNEPMVQLELTPEGRTKFAEATETFLNKTISIYMDEELLSSPTVESVITNGNATISGSFKQEEVIELADKINAGSLPFKLISKNYNTISPTLGAGALHVMVTAGVVAFILISLFMLLYYRVPGFVAVIALIGQVAGAVLAVSIPQFTLTLPGIAGIILSIGMGVDANVLSSERIKEEIRAGRTITGAVETGYSNAWSAILDGNVTVAIVAVILYIFGSGAIRSFGYTLGVGVIFNFIMGVTASQLMQKALCRFKFLRRAWLYGGKRS